MEISKHTQIALLLIVIILIPFSILSFVQPQPKSPYQLAVENGFEGTEQEWLDSLYGKSAYDIAVENGFKGTEQEWLDSLNGQDGTNGKDGENKIEDLYSTYLAAKQNGEIDESVTYLEFLQKYLNNSNDATAANIAKNIMSVVQVETFRNSTTYNNNEYSSGACGVVYQIDADGNALIITNYHVIYNSNLGKPYPYFKIALLGQEKTTIPAELYGAARQYDIAILKVTNSEALKNSNLQAVSFSEKIYAGQACYAVGNTQLLGITVTKGVISVESEEVKMTVGGREMHYREIRHDAYISHGNSGGGLFNAYGKLIGITNGGKETSITGGKETTLINYAIPSSIVSAVAQNLIKNKTDDAVSQIKIYQTGIENNLNATESYPIYNSETSQIDMFERVVISKVDSGSLIASLGCFAAGDEIISIKYKGVTYDNTNCLLRTFTLSELLISAAAGDEFEITVKRNNDVEEVPNIHQEEIVITRTITLSEEFATLYV